MDFPDLHKGVKAYFDTFSGCIPCIVQEVSGSCHVPTSGITVQFKLTANRGAYKKGEVFTRSSLHVFPREARKIKGGQYRIGHYTVGTVAG